MLHSVLLSWTTDWRDTWHVNPFPCKTACSTRQGDNLHWKSLILELLEIVFSIYFRKCLFFSEFFLLLYVCVLKLTLSIVGDFRLGEELPLMYFFSKQGAQHSLVNKHQPAVNDREKPLLERSRVSVLDLMGFLGDQAGHGGVLGQLRSLLFTRALWAHMWVSALPERSSCPPNTSQLQDINLLQRW